MVHILAVDDDPVFRAFLEKTFKDSEFSITTEENPETPSRGRKNCSRG